MKAVMFRATVRALIVGAAFAWSAAYGAEAQEISVATEGAYPPFNTTEADGTLAGFEIELGNAVCQKADLDCKWVKQDFTGMIPALLAGKFDVVFSAMSITAEREKAAVFSIPYFRDAFRFYGKIDAQDQVDPAGKRIGVLTGSSGEAFVRRNWPDATVVGYADTDLVNSDLEAGRIDYGFNTQLPIEMFMKSDEGKGYNFVGPLYTGEELGRGMGAMFRPGADDLKQRFDGAIKAVYEDGTFDRIAEKYFGKEIDVRASDLW